MSNPGPAAFPEADADSLAHGERVAAHLRGCIERAGGTLAFAEFMHEALYAPGLGYYAAGSTKFGAAGDFVTAPEISPLFGRVLGRQCAELLRAFGDAAILELGAGTGRLSADLLRFLAEAGVDVGRYLILEISPELAARQRATICSAVPALAGRVEWIDRLPDRISGVVIANEVADALPVERFVHRHGEVGQLRVGLDGDRFRWCEAPAPPFLERAVRRIEASLGRPLPDGYVSEVSTGLPDWIRDIAARIGRGFVFLVDYGVPRREYYAPDRDGGWLRCHFRHRVHDDPLILAGLQDLTCWVDFTAVAEAASDAGMAVAGFVTQAHFLLHGGLDEEIREFERLPIATQIELAGQVKMLTLPGEMGEHCKCIGLSRGSLPVPEPFRTGDRAHGL